MKALAWVVALGVTLALLGPTGGLSAQTASTEEARKAEAARRAEELRRAIRSPQAARERFEAMRKAQEQIEAARKGLAKATPDGQSPDRLMTSTAAR